MKFTNEVKGRLWFVLERYDRISEYDSFCNSLSNLIKDSGTGDDLLTVFRYLPKVDLSDKKEINNTIGADIDACLFSI
jgi:hypothetical protein